MKKRQSGLLTSSKFRHRLHRPRNCKSPTRPGNIKIGISIENDGGWTVGLPKGKAARFIEHCRNSGVGFTLITGVYSGLCFATRDRVLFDCEFDLEQLQELVGTFEQTEAGQRSGAILRPPGELGSLNQIEPTNSNERYPG